MPSKRELVQRRFQRKEDIRNQAGRLDLALVPDKYLYPVASFPDDLSAAERTQKWNEGGEQHLLLEDDPEYGKLAAKQRWTFSLPASGFYGIKYSKASFMLAFYSDDYPRVSLSFLSFCAVLGVLFDAFTDPYVSAWTDNMRFSVYGRRKPFLFFAAILSPML